jgi:hypothetical protein
VADQLGTIEPGKLAHLTVVEKGRYFDEDAKVREVWIDGRQFLAPIKDDPKKEADANADGKADEKKKKDNEKEKLRGQLTSAPAEKYHNPLLAPKAVFIKSATLWTSGPQGRHRKREPCSSWTAKFVRSAPSPRQTFPRTRTSSIARASTSLRG